MRDYAETVDRLRLNEKLFNERDAINIATLYRDAADAIEELLADNTEAFSADIISMKNAVETDVWLMVWAVEPNRKIHVQMTYDELWRIVQMERENAIEQPREDADNG